MQRIRLLLLPFSAIYALILRFRHFLYDIGLFKSKSFDIPTIVVGNLALGGTGKSPVTLYLAEMLSSKYRVAILSRGYGRKTKGFHLLKVGDTADIAGDEPLQFFRRGINNVQVAVCEDRCTGIEELLKLNPPPEVILLDDAMQHRKLKASLYLMLSQAKKPFCNDFLVPAGTLRDIKSRAKTADILLWTKSEHKQDSTIESKAQRYALKAAQYSTKLNYSAPKSLFESEATDFLSVITLTGIADPQPFLNHVASRWRIEKSYDFADHHAFTDQEIESLIADSEKFSIPILCTEKDAMRLLSYNQLKEKRIPVLYIPISLEFIEGKPKFEATILNHIKTFH